MTKPDHVGLLMKLLTAAVILIAVMVILALVNAVSANNTSSQLLTGVQYVSSGQIQTSYMVQSLSGAGAPLAMVMPNDLVHYVGKQFHIYSTTAQPHVIEIGAGSISTSWTAIGVNRIATFGGAIGDGISFHVGTDKRIIVTNTNNVVFSP